MLSSSLASLASISHRICSLVYCRVPFFLPQYLAPICLNTRFSCPSALSSLAVSSTLSIDDHSDEESSISTSQLYAVGLLELICFLLCASLCSDDSRAMWALASADVPEARGDTTLHNGIVQLRH
jgi:hypothetical protein